MASQSGHGSEWIAESVPHYRLRKDDLVDWLKRKFPKRTYGRDDFKVQVMQSDEVLLVLMTADHSKLKQDRYNFEVPKRLSKVS